MKAKSTHQLQHSELPFAIGAPALVWQVLFFYLPLILIFFSSFVRVTESGQLVGPTLEHIKQFLSPVYLKVVLASLILAISNSVLCLLIGYPLAYFLTFTGKKYKNILLFLIIVPFWTNFLLHVYAWHYVLDRNGILNQMLLSIGMIQEPLRLLNTPFAIMIMMVYYYLPFMVLPIYSSLEKLDYRLVEASLDLGASFSSTFKRIMLPLTARGIRAGIFLVYIPSFGEFAIPELMGGDKHMFVGNVVSQYILGEGTGSLGSAFTVLSCLILLLSVIGFYFLFKRILTTHHV